MLYLLPFALAPAQRAPLHAMPHAGNAPIAPIGCFPSLTSTVQVNATFILYPHKAPPNVFTLACPTLTLPPPRRARA